MLLYKLLATGIDGKMYFIIKALYTHTSSCINVNNNLTEWFDTLFGVRQGDCLSPSLFNIFINDLAVGIKEISLGVNIETEKVSILMYADDVAFITENERDMQTLLDFTHTWCETWHMKINMSKTKVMHFRKRNNPRSEFELKLGDHLLHYVDKYKYLGVIIDEFLTFDEHIQVMANSGKRALGGIIAKYKKLENMGYDTYTKCFGTSMLPIINYGSEIIGYIKNNKTEVVQMKAMKSFLGVHRFAANAAVEGDMGWYPNSMNQTLIVLRYWSRLLLLENERFTKKIFNYDYKFAKKGNWCSFVKKTLSSLEMENIYINKLPCDLALCKSKLIEMYNNEWILNLTKKSKLCT